MRLGAGFHRSTVRCVAGGSIEGIVDVLAGNWTESRRAASALTRGWRKWLEPAEFGRKLTECMHGFAGRVDGVGACPGPPAAILAL
jgi:hypothetical protein